VSDLIISKRYAKALMSLGKEDGNYAEYGRQLAEFAELFAASGELVSVLTNPQFNLDDRRRVLGAIMDKTGQTGVIRNFLNLMLDKDRIGLVPEVLTVYQGLTDELAGLKRAEVTSATPLADAEVARVKEVLTGVVGGRVEVDIQVDESLIGGLVARIGDLVFDGSVKTQLLGLKESLKRGELV
jgi:F-type H+-transporting ATPase subunit delta